MLHDYRSRAAKAHESRLFGSTANYRHGFTAFSLKFCHKAGVQTLRTGRFTHFQDFLDAI